MGVGRVLHRVGTGMRVLVGLLVVGVLVSAVLLPDSGPDDKTVTAHFPRAVSVYVGTDVRILGVNVGRVTAVVPEGNSVRVEMTYGGEYDVPADAQAAIITPTLVADRFVQLTPVFTEGAVLADGADIPLPRTAVPVELDRIYASLRDLAVTLGPNGVNADGTLDHLLAAGTKALEGQGAQGNQMIRDLSAAAETFGTGSGPLFETVTQLAQFTDTLAQNDELVRAFLEDLAGVSAALVTERQELQQALASVASAVGTVKTFVKDNRKALVTDVQRLTRVVKAINRERSSIDTALTVAPVAIGNLSIAYNPQTGAVGSRINVNGNVADPDGFLCGIVQQSPQLAQASKDLACRIFKQLLEPVTSSLGDVPPASRRTTSRTSSRGSAAPPAGAYLAPVDPSLSGLLGGTR